MQCPHPQGAAESCPGQGLSFKNCNEHFRGDGVSDSGCECRKSCPGASPGLGLMDSLSQGEIWEVSVTLTGAQSWGINPHKQPCSRVFRGEHQPSVFPGTAQGLILACPNPSPPLVDALLLFPSIKSNFPFSLPRPHP